MPELSVVTTLYRSQQHIQEFYIRIKQCVEQITTNYEIIMVDDGSDDQSLELAKSIAAKDHKVMIIELSKNFGHHRAVAVGLTHARGDLIFLIDSDLEEDPEYLIQFYHALQETGSDVVYGVQDHRKGGWFEKISGWFFYKLANHFCETQIPENATTIRLMTKNYVKSLFLHQETTSNLGFLMAITGFRQLPMVIHKHDKGVSQYNLKRKIALFADTIVAFSTKPFIYLLRLGLMITFSALCYLLWALLAGHNLVVGTLWFFGGVILSALGLMGIYLRMILLEVKKRPNAIVKNIYMDQNIVS